MVVVGSKIWFSSVMNIDIGDMVKINTFDDGNERYRMNPNVWRVVGTMFQGGKLQLTNGMTLTAISSISAWKCSRI